MYDLISRQQMIDLLDRWSGGYEYIETKTDAAITEVQNLPQATCCGFAVSDLFKTAVLLRKAGIAPEELREMCGCIDAAFDFISGLLKMEQQEMVNKALSHWMKPEA